MSDSNKSSADPGKDDPSASVTGKGWDILVGGKENSVAAGGADPFDMNKTAPSATTADVRAKDAETDAILKSVSGQPVDSGAALPPEAALDAGRGAEAPRDLGPQELATPGVSAGVTVTPVGGSSPAPSGPITITEVTKPGTAPLNSSAITEITKPAAPVTAPAPSRPVFPPVPSAPAPGSGITEVSGPMTPTGPLAPTAPMPSMPPARTLPAANPAAPLPFVPGTASPQSGGFASQTAIGDPFSTQVDTPLKLVGPDVPPDPVLEKQLITSSRIDALWNAINETYDLVINDVRGHFNTTEEAIEQLAHARELLVSGPANFDEAEELVMDVKARLRLEEKVRQWSVARGTWIATYLILWFPLLSLATFTTNNVMALNDKFKLVPEFLASTWLPAIFGIFGGAVGALWVLNKHMTKKRDFDPIHTMWYVTNPFLGGALGVVAYFLVRGGGFLVTQAGGSDTFNLTPPLTVVLCTLSVLVGFNQNILWSLVDRFLKTVFPETKEDQIAVTDASASSTSSSSSDSSDSSGSGGGD